MPSKKDSVRLQGQSATVQDPDLSKNLKRKQPCSQDTTKTKLIGLVSLTSDSECLKDGSEAKTVFASWQIEQGGDQ